MLAVSGCLRQPLLCSVNLGHCSKPVIRDRDQQIIRPAPNRGVCKKLGLACWYEYLTSFLRSYVEARAVLLRRWQVQEVTAGHSDGPCSSCFDLLRYLSFPDLKLTSARGQVDGTSSDSGIHSGTKAKLSSFCPPYHGVLCLRFTRASFAQSTMEASIWLLHDWLVKGYPCESGHLPKAS